jgi:hypothetical protein
MNILYNPEARQTFEYIVLGVLFVFWLLRKTSLGFLWRGFLVVLIGALIVLFAGYAKKEVKDWWNKD